MAPRSKHNFAPVTFDLPQELIAKIKVARRSRRLKTTSAVVRLAIEQFDFEACTPAHVPHQQISVRVAGPQRAMLKRYARSKGVSVGELLRLALEGLPLKLVRSARRS